MSKIAATPPAPAEIELPNPDRGFLPEPDPPARLPQDFAAWEQAAAQLPKLMLSNRLRSILADLPPFEPGRLGSRPELERAMLVLSFLGHAYVWGAPVPAERLPDRLAVPWHRTAQRLGRPPVLSYASYALYNWRRIDPGGPIALGNLALLQNFLGGLDEEWFVLVHVEIEASAAPALAALPPARQAAAHGDETALISNLEILAETLENLCGVLERMPERCDPYIYYNRVRPYIHGWKDNPALPRGIIYEGVNEYGGRPQRFRGETGAQSAIVPSLDAALGVVHADDPLKTYLREMRDYMPSEHRAFVAALESGPEIRSCVLRRRKNAALREAYNACIRLLDHFRHTHLRYAARYVHRQSRRSNANPAVVGTGGTPFMAYLGKHRDETEKHLIPR